MGRYDLLHQHIDNAQRLRVIAHVRIADIVSAPAHRVLRDPGAVLEIEERLRSGDLAAALGEVFLLGVFTELDEAGAVRLRAVECLDGHHRLVAGLRAGVWERVCDLPVEGVDTRVNGCPAESDLPEARWIPLIAAQQSTIPSKEWRELPQGGAVRGATAEISGRISSTDTVFAEEHRGLPLGELLRRIPRAER